MFLKDEQFANQLTESGLVINEFLQVSPMAVPSVRVMVSGVLPFVPDEALE